MSKAIHLGCGGEIVSERDEMRETFFGFMSVTCYVEPWCHKCGHKIRPEFIVRPNDLPVLSDEEGRAIKVKLLQEAPWLKVKPESYE